MNDQTPPLGLGDPEIFDRRNEPGRRIKSSTDAIEQREIKAGVLRQQLNPIRRHLGTLTAAQRRAFFVKLQHSGPISLTGTGLKRFSPISDNVTLAVATDSLERFDDKLTRYGNAPLANEVIPESALVGRLVEIAVGTPLDRVSDEIFESFSELASRDWLTIEIELVSLQAGPVQRRNEIANGLNRLTDFLGRGIHGTIYEHEEDKGACRAMIGCTGEAFRTLVQDRDWQTLISWFELPPAFETFHHTLRNFQVADLGGFIPPNTDNVVCVVDSGVLPENAFLNPIARRDLMRSFLKDRADDIVDEHGHGSGVASLVSYYALNLAAGAEQTAKCWIASARILDENNELKDRLLSVVLEEVVETFSSIGIKIFNLSVNIFNRPWNPSTRRIHPKRSWTARTIDRLSRERDVLFILSVGNLTMATVGTLIADAPYPQHFSRDYCSILDPGQAALAISVGSLAASTQIVGVAGQITAIAERDQPSPFTRIGPGIRGEHKPELVEYGGNLAFDHDLTRVRENAGGNVVMATNSLNPAITTSFGTSFAAPRVTYHAAQIADDLRLIGVNSTGPLLRAFLISSAEYPQSESFVDAIHSLRPDVDYRDVVGYGVPDAFRATYCDDFDVVMYYQGALTKDKVALFDIPVPELLIETGRGPKRLSITVCFNPEVHNRGFGEYFGSTMQWRLFRGDVDREAIIEQISRPLEDEENGPAPEPPRVRLDLSGAHGLQRRSRGTAQYDAISWDLHGAEFSRNHYTLAVTTFEKWQRANPAPVPYAVVVRLEEQSRRVAIYDSVAIALEPQIEVRG